MILINQPVQLLLLCVYVCIMYEPPVTADRRQSPLSWADSRAAGVTAQVLHGLP